MYQKEIEAREKLIVDKRNLFVQAGAGAGKTTSLVTRIVKSLEGGVLPSEIVAISFTNNSAEDLRGKIIKKLNEEKKMDILNHIDEMHISTIHKFCGDLLKENSIHAKLSPDFKIISPEDLPQMTESVVVKYIRDMKYKDWKYFNELGIARYKASGFIKSIYYALISHVDKIEWDNIFKYENKKDLNEIYEDAFIASQNILNKVYEYQDSIYNLLLSKRKDKELKDIFKKDSIFYFDSEATDTDIKKIADYLLKKEYKPPFNGSIMKNDEYKEMLIEFDSDVEDDVKKFVELRIEYKALFKNKVLEHAYNAYLEFLKVLNGDLSNVTTDESIFLAKELLVNNKNIAKRLHNKYKHIYIDEYQDTDHLQRDIALSLTQKDDKTFYDTALYLVGDPKQSIYRFRGAEPEVYFNTKEMFKVDGTGIYDLNINFRSNSKILDWVNEKYENIPLTDQPYPEMLCADANKITDEEYDNPDNIIGFYRSNGNTPAAVSGLIKYLKTKKVRRVYVEKENGEKVFKHKFDNIKYSDIMVLMQNHNSMAEYVRVFNENNIPTKVAGESNFETSFAVRAFVNLFEVVNTRGKKNLVKANEVFKAVFSNLLVGKSKNEEEEILFNIYKNLKKEVLNMSSYGKAIYLVNHLNWIIPNNASLEDFVINSIKSKLYQMIEEVFSNNYQNGNELCKSFRKYLKKPIEYESQIDNDADAVQVINVHKSKGLEAPICIWLTIDKEKDGAGTCFKDGMLYLSVKNGFETLNFYDHDPLKKEELMNDTNMEKARIEYVGATRPKEAFIFATGDKNNGMFFRSGVDYNINELREIDYSNYQDVNIDLKEKISYKPDIHNYNLEHNNSIVTTSPSSMENNISETRERLKNECYKAEGDRPKGNILGTAMHRAFELLIKGYDIDYSIKLAIEENKDDINDIDSYYRFIKASINELNKYYKDKGYYNYKLYPELGFSYLKDDKLISNGSIDLLLIKDDEAIIIDYKSDAAEYIIDDEVFEKTLIEKYENQLNEYELTVKRLFSNINKISKRINLIKVEKSLALN